MVDLFLEIVAAIGASILSALGLDEWYREQSWWVRSIIIATFIFIIAMVAYLVLILPIWRVTRNG